MEDKNKSINVTANTHYILDGLRYEMRLRTFNEVIMKLIEEYKSKK
jgi:hypothetical protein